MKHTFIALLALCLCLHVVVSAENTYLDTLVKLRVPKKESKRSTEDGLEHVSFRIWLPVEVKMIRGVTFNPFLHQSRDAEALAGGLPAMGVWNFGGEFFRSEER